MNWSLRVLEVTMKIHSAHPDNSLRQLLGTQRPAAPVLALREFPVSGSGNGGEGKQTSNIESQWPELTDVTQGISRLQKHSRGPSLDCKVLEGFLKEETSEKRADKSKYKKCSGNEWSGKAGARGPRWGCGGGEWGWSGWRSQATMSLNTRLKGWALF